MFPTYPAVLRAGQLEWEDGRPPDEPVRVHVTVIAPLAPSAASGPSMASALEALAAAGGPSGFDALKKVSGSFSDAAKGS